MTNRGRNQKLPPQISETGISWAEEYGFKPFWFKTVTACKKKRIKLKFNNFGRNEGMVCAL